MNKNIRRSIVIAAGVTGASTGVHDTVSGPAATAATAAKLTQPAQATRTATAGGTGDQARRYVDAKVSAAARIQGAVGGAEGLARTAVPTYHQDVPAVPDVERVQDVHDVQRVQHHPQDVQGVQDLYGGRDVRYQG
jgi:hypothetical protein